PPAGGGLTGEQRKEREALLERCQAAGSQDHYATLGIDRTAGDDAVRHAYYKLARLYHPDRLQKPHLADMQRQLEGMFAAITEAYNALGHPAARAEYDRELAGRAGKHRKDGALDKPAAARDAFLRGRKAMETGDTFEAIRLFETAVENDPSRAEYFHHLGLCQGQNPRWRKRAEESLLKAIQMNPGSVASYLELARVYRKGGLERRSMEMYQQALQWDPTNAEALEATAARGREGTSTGILRSLFKKE
ncbi:MAG TPA: DnaJ domain-containing protein, partial [Candidatus Polarisedimenticolia bacterium]|nr:DnaJ domain-containing protein [Candidatus Polarisedimenticolia bacterium]